MITEYEAAESLRHVHSVGHRTHLARTYREASAHLILAGAIWIAGYIGMAITRPEQWAVIWMQLIIVGVIGSYVMALRTGPSRVPDPAAWITSVGSVVYAARVLWGIGAVMVFIVMTYLLFRPAALLPYIVFPAFVLALVYALVGSFGATRFVWIGFGVFAVTELGLLLAPDAMPYFVAAGGGGGLLLGGLGLRSA